MSSTHPQSLHGQMLGQDRMVMPSPLTSAIGQGMYLQGVRNEPKITLLSRPQQPFGTVDPSPIGTIAPPRSSYECYQNPGLNAPQLSHGVSSGRAARDDYFDTEDPSVNLHDFIINSMQSQKNRVILVKLEEEFVSYVDDISRVEPLKLPPWDSYHRMLAHRVAAYFGLEHNVDQIDKKCVVVHKGPNTRLPQRRFVDCMSKPRDQDDAHAEPSEPKHILKRTAKELETILGSSSDLHVSGVKSLKTFEEREEEYERARARIFSQQSPLESKETSSVFDLETPSALTRRKSRILPAIMQHRRAASDTSAFLYNRGGLSDLLKEGPSSDHSSRSITPLLSQHHKSTEALARAFGSHQDLDHLDQSHASTKTLSPLTPRKESQANTVAHSPPKFSKSLSDYQPPASSAVETHEPSSGSPTAVQFQPVQAGVPVIYQQPGAVIADPNWYPYPQQMMVYQLSPQGYIPAPHYSPIGPTMLQPGQFYAINQPYPTVPAGGLTAAPVIATGKDVQLSPQGVSTRPGGVQGYEQYPSPTHTPGIALVRPIPQQASVRVASKPVGSWGSAVPQSYAVHPSVMVQPNGDQPPYAALVPYQQDIKPSALPEQMESLHLSGPDRQAAKENSKVTGTTSSELVPSSQFVKPVAVVGTSTTVDSVALGGVPQNVVGGPMISPTLPRGPVQFIPQQHPMYGGGPEATFIAPGSQGSIVRYPAGLSPQVSSPAQPAAPGPLNFPPGVLQARPQGVFSPSNAGLTHSPVQILGHTLGTSLFSPPPSSVSHPALFGQAVNGKVMGESPSHPPIGTGAVAESPVSYINGSTTSGGSQSSQLPPRLGRPQKGGANRYQNQRHPANRVNKPGSAEFTSTDNVAPTASGRKEALLPTPPSHHLVKLDTDLTCGVPVNVMELVSVPPDGSAEMHQAMQVLTDMGVLETKTGVMPKTGERVVIAVFENAECAVKALQIKHPFFVLSIPGNNHAKFILSLL